MPCKNDNPEINLNWLFTKNEWVVEIVNATDNPTKAKEMAISLRVLDRDIRYVLRLGRYKRDHTSDGVYEALMKEYNIAKIRGRKHRQY